MDERNSVGLSGFLTGPRNHFTPLFIIAGLIAVVESMLVIGVTQTDGWIQVVITVTVCIHVFFLLVLGGLYAIIWSRPHHLYAPNLYAPSEHGHPTSAIELSEAIRRSQAVPNVAAAREVVAVESRAAVEEPEAGNGDARHELPHTTLEERQDVSTWERILEVLQETEEST